MAYGLVNGTGLLEDLLRKRERKYCYLVMIKIFEMIESSSRLKKDKK